MQELTIYIGIKGTRKIVKLPLEIEGTWSATPEIVGLTDLPLDVQRDLREMQPIYFGIRYGLVDAMVEGIPSVQHTGQDTIVVVLGSVSATDKGCGKSYRRSGG